MEIVSIKSMSKHLLNKSPWIACLASILLTGCGSDEETAQDSGNGAAAVSNAEMAIISVKLNFGSRLETGSGAPLLVSAAIYGEPAKGMTPRVEKPDGNAVKMKWEKVELATDGTQAWESTTSELAPGRYRVSIETKTGAFSPSATLIVTDGPAGKRLVDYHSRQISLARGQADSVLAEVEKQLAREPGNLALLLELAALYKSAGRESEHRNVFERIATVISPSADPAERYRAVPEWIRMQFL